MKAITMAVLLSFPGARYGAQHFLSSIFLHPLLWSGVMAELTVVGFRLKPV